MAKSVVIVESPAKARTIGKFLGPDYRVESCMGHVRDLPKKTFGVNIEDGFRPTYRLLPDRRQVVARLKKAAAGAPAVYLATDPDREGEAIAWHLLKALGVSERRARRVTFNEITRRAVSRGFGEPRGLDMNLVNAQQARRILDRIMGYQLSPLLSRKVARGLSAGRVQSVAVRLIVEREKEIQAFEPKEYWEITATLAPEAREATFKSKLSRLEGQKPEIPDEATAKAVVERLAGERFVVAEVATRRSHSSPLPPFATSQLQQAASVRLGFRPRKTMRVAQQLYEGVEIGEEGSVGLITYMRTDSFRIADEALAECRSFIERELGGDYLSPEPRVYRSRRGAQEAHEAIRPTSVERTPESLEAYLTPDQLKLYRLIWERFVACQMAPAAYDVTTVVVRAGPAEFRVRGRVVVFEGFTRVYQPPRRGGKDEQPLPELAAGMVLDCREIVPSQHFTKPPPRYTEASLVKTLEREGIGRPSTYAEIITKIQERGYVELRDRLFYATELGILTNDVLLPFFENIINTNFTSQMEEHLDAIEEGRVDWRSVLREFYEPFRADLERAYREMPSVKKRMAKPTGEKCPQCGAEMVVRMSKRGRFIGCSAYPKCRYTKPLDEGGRPPDEPLEEKCPECGAGLVVKSGRRGRFIGCSAYPKCRYTRPLEQPAGQPRPEPVETGEKCPKCGAPLVEREGRRGKFVGCSAYPKCDYTRDAEGSERAAPQQTEVKCQKCGAPMVIRRGRRGRFLGCSAYPKCKNTMALSAAGIKVEPKQVGRDCPRCGAPLVEREGRRGTFIGCSAFPKCRYIEGASERKENEDGGN